jgi:hypothetical protein
MPHAAPRGYDLQVITPPDETFATMNDTVKIERPLHCRRHEDFGGRIKKDSEGNIVKVRTRTHDHQDDAPASWLSSGVAKLS